MPIKITKNISNELSDEQVDHIKDGVKKFLYIIDLYEIDYFCKYIENYFVQITDTAVFDEFVNSLNTIFPAEFSIFFVNFMINLDIEEKLFKKLEESNTEHLEELIENLKMIACRSGIKLKHLMANSIGRNDWKRITTNIGVKDEVGIYYSRIVLNNRKALEWCFHYPSIIELVNYLIQVTQQSVGKFGPNVLLDIKHENLLDSIRNLLDEITEFNADEKGVINDDISNEELNELSNTILLENGMLKTKIIFKNYSEIIAFNSNLDSLIILIEHLLRHIIDSKNKIQIENRLVVRTEKLDQIKENFTHLTERRSEIAQKYKENLEETETIKKEI